MSKPVFKIVGVLAALGFVTLTLCVLLLLGVLSPEPATEELASRPIPNAVVEQHSTAPPAAAFQVTGRVQHEDGEPVEGVEVAARQGFDEQETTTAADGTFQLDLEGAATVRLPGRISTPEEVEVDGPTDLHFVIPPLCALTIRVIDQGDGPVSARVYLSMRRDRGSHTDSVREETDEAGWVRFPQAQCGVARLKVKAKGYVTARRDDVDTVVDTEIMVRLTRGIRLSGAVVDEHGEGIGGAYVSAGDSRTTSEDDGQYTLLIDPTDVRKVRASAEGYSSTSERLRIPEGGEEEEVWLDLVLEGTREVTVYCAGMPDDSCDTVMPIMCTHPLIPFGGPCSGEPTRCECPEGDAAVRGGGDAVRIDGEQDVAWLDMRHGGGLTGRVLVEGEPSPCKAQVLRLPEGLEDMTRGMANMRMLTCDEDGRFRASGLAAGKWTVEVSAGDNKRSVPATDVDGKTVDLGDIDLAGGGTISGYVIDGLTGDGAPNIQVVAVCSSCDPTAPTTGMGTSASEGRFRIQGLPDGDYDVLIATRPFNKTPVTLEDGEAEEVELETASATMLEENGYALATDEEGELVVDRVDPDGPAAGAGLEEGDVVVGVELMGINPADLLPGMGDELTDAILETWSGPGVDLLVERDGEQVMVPME
jgi:hypothetical protein